MVSRGFMFSVHRHRHRQSPLPLGKHASKSQIASVLDIQGGTAACKEATRRRG